MGIIVDKFPLNYETFDDKVASGKNQDNTYIMESPTGLEPRAAATGGCRCQEDDSGDY